MATPAERSLAVFPGGSLGEYNLPPELTVVLTRGAGPTVWGTEGRAFTDFTMGWPTMRGRAWHRRTPHAGVDRGGSAAQRALA